MVGEDGPAAVPKAPAAIPEKPFALRSLLYTIGFLVIVLGVVPSVFFLVGRLASTHESAKLIIQEYWTTLRALVGVSVFAAGLISYSACSAWLIFHGRGPHVEFDPPKVFVATDTLGGSNSTRSEE